MPALSRAHAVPLLRMVKGKPYATNEDHVDQLPTPPGTNSSTRSSFIGQKNAMEEDITRSPVSSEDEAESSGAREQQLPAKSAGFQTPRQVENEGESAMKKSTFRRPPQPQSSPHSERSKRSRDKDRDGSSSDSGGIFGPGGSKRSKSSGFANIHAPTARRKVKKQYGSQNQSRAAAAEKASKFQKREDAAEKHVEPPRPKFQMARGTDDDMFEFGQEMSSAADFQSSGPLEDIAGDTLCARERSSLSPSPSSLPSSPVIEGMQITDNSISVSPICPICSAPISEDLTLTFRHTFTKGSPIFNYRWQQRFCRWHRQQDSHCLSKERGYPVIDWKRLPARMRRCERRLKLVIMGEERSFYRDQLAEVLGSGKPKTALSAIVADEGIRREGGGCGYYGPKGERAITEHIISRLSSEIRQQSINDRLVAAAGISGGVSGFVHAVLVPELAECLIREDMKVESGRARQIMAESAEIGELLHPDANDWVGEVEVEVVEE